MRLLPRTRCGHEVNLQEETCVEEDYIGKRKARLGAAPGLNMFEPEDYFFFAGAGAGMAIAGTSACEKPTHLPLRITHVELT